jgi:hypothetical protein
LLKQKNGVIRGELSERRQIDLFAAACDVAS